MWSCAHAGRDCGVPPAAGPLRRCNDSVVSGHPDGNFSGIGTADGDGNLGRRNVVYADPRSHDGWMDYRQLELAVEFLHQLAVGNTGLPDGLDLRARSTVFAAAPGRPDRLLRGHLASCVARADANRGRSGTTLRLVRGAVGGMVEHHLRTFDDCADLQGTAIPDTHPRPPHSEKATVFCCRMPDDSPQLSAVWHWSANAHLSSGIH